jgi:type I restriction enzyme S subunit
MRLGDFLQEVDVRSATVTGQLPVLSLTRHFGLMRQADRFKNPVASEDTSHYKVVRPQQLVYSPIKIWEGGIGVLNLPSPGIVSPVYTVWDIQGADPKFVHYLLRSPQLIREYSRYAEGTGQRRQSLRRPDFLGIEVALPPLEEQHRLANALDTIQEARAATSRVAGTKLRLLESLRTHLFSAVQPQPIPLRDLLRGPLRNGYSPVAAATGTVRVLTLSAVTNDEFSDRHTKLAAKGDRRIDDLWLTPGDILIERANTRDLVGSSALYAGPDNWAIFPDLMIRVRPDETLIDPSVLIEYLRLPDVRRYFSQHARGSAGSMPKIDHEIVARLPVTVPPKELQAKMKHAFEAMRASVKAARIAEEALVALFTATRAEIFASAV